MAVRPLVLTVDAQIDPFKRAMSAGKAALAELGNAANDEVGKVEAVFRQLAADPAAGVEAMTKSLTAQIAAGRRQAQTILNQQTPDASGVLSSQGYLEAAVQVDQLAASRRNVAAAALAAAAAGGEEAQILRTIATAAAAEAAALDHNSEELLRNASARGLVEAELDKMGIASAAVIAEQERAAAAAAQFNAQMDMLRQTEAAAADGARLLIAAHAGTALSFDHVSKSAAQSAAVFQQAFREEEQAAAELARDINLVRQEIDPTLIAQQRLDTELERAERAFAAGAIGAEGYGVAVNKAADRFAGYVNASEVVAARSGNMKAGMQQLSYQINDVATSLSSGASGSMVFAQQSGQVIQALQLMTGDAKGFLGVLGGHWGLVIASAVTILVGLISHMDLFGNEVDEAAEKLAKQAHETDVARAAQQAYDNTLEGSIAAQNKFTEALDKRIKSQRELNAEQLTEAQGNLGKSRGAVSQAQADVDRWRAELDKARARSDNAGTNPMAIAAAGLDLGKIQAAYDAAVKTLNAAKAAVATGERGVRDAQIVIARGDLPGQADPKVAQRQQLQNKIDKAFADYAAGKISAAVRDGITVPTQKLLDTLGRSTGGSGGASQQASVGDMTALLKQLFPGVRITSTTGGRHVAGSDHYASRAIDFVPAGGMGQYSKADVLQKLEDAGVKIRRNAGGTQQFFGPGDKGHSDHFHVAWSGTPSPESADQRAEAAARRRQAEADRTRHDGEAYDQALDEARVEQARLARDGVRDLQQLATLDKAAIDAALEKKLDANAKAAIDHRWTAAQREGLDAIDRENADTKKREIDRHTAQQLSERDIEARRNALGLQSRLLEIEGQLAPTLKERLRIALALLENDRRQQLLANDLERDQGRIDAAEHDRRAAGINDVADRQGAVVRRQNAGPLDQYRQQLVENVGDMDTALEGVKAHGLQSLEEGLLGIVNGTESVGSAFKKMAMSIIADLARIAIQKAILSAIGLPFADGGPVPLRLAGGGAVHGPGGEREDRVPAMLSPGEFVINAASTRRHRRLIQAINDNTLPGFADGGMIGDVAYPAMPSAMSLRAGGGGAVAPIVHQHITITSSILSTELMQHMNRVGATAVAVGPGLAMDEMSERSMMRIPS